MFLLAPYLAFIPVPALSGVLLAVSSNMVTVRADSKRIFAIDR